MGDLHNLFGRVNEVHVFLDPDEPAGFTWKKLSRAAPLSNAWLACSTTK